MRVLRLSWVGTRTPRYEQTVDFFHGVLGLEVSHREDDFAVLDVPGGATVEVFGERSVYNRHLTSPVAGFGVDDLESAAAELRDAGVEIVLPVTDGDTGRWLHFRAPDGFLYELSEQLG